MVSIDFITLRIKAIQRSINVVSVPLPNPWSCASRHSIRHQSTCLRGSLVLQLHCCGFPICEESSTFRGCASSHKNEEPLAYVSVHFRSLATSKEIQQIGRLYTWLHHEVLWDNGLVYVSISVFNTIWFMTHQDDRSFPSGQHSILVLSNPGISKLL